MSGLSIFVDESGDFGEYAKHSPYYAVTMVFHDQGVDLSQQIEILNRNLNNLGYENVAIHTEPLLQRRYDENKLKRSDLLLFQSSNDLRKE